MTFTVGDHAAQAASAHGAPGGLVRRLFGTAARVAAGAIDPWRRLDSPAPLTAFGPGARQEFAWYLTRQSTVHIPDGAALAAWLLDCEYVRDEHHFAAEDVWQHPCDFETIRRGDCEDHALWAWRKFLELGYESELVVGRCAAAEPQARHAWVLVRLGAAPYVVETTARSPELMIQPLAYVRGAYLPECGVGRDLRPFVYAGLLQNPHL